MFLPGVGMRDRDPRKRADHRSVIPGVVAMGLVQVTYDVADAFVAHHPRRLMLVGVDPAATGEGHTHRQFPNR